MVKPHITKVMELLLLTTKSLTLIYKKQSVLNIAVNSNKAITSEGLYFDELN